MDNAEGVVNFAVVTGNAYDAPICDRFVVLSFDRATAPDAIAAVRERGEFLHEREVDGSVVFHNGGWANGINVGSLPRAAFIQANFYLGLMDRNPLQPAVNWFETPIAGDEPVYATPYDYGREPGWLALPHDHIHIEFLCPGSSIEYLDFDAAALTRLRAVGITRIPVNRNRMFATRVTWADADGVEHVRDVPSL